jgi:hypothetical protein
MTNKQVTDTVDKNLRNTYEGLPNLVYVHLLLYSISLSLLSFPDLFGFRATKLVRTISKACRSLVTGKMPWLMVLIYGMFHFCYFSYISWHTC